MNRIVNFIIHDALRDKSIIKPRKRRLDKSANRKSVKVIHLSADKAVSVKTETPIEMSFENSESLQTASPQGQESIV